MIWNKKRSFDYSITSLSDSNEIPSLWTSNFFFVFVNYFFSGASCLLFVARTITDLRVKYKNINITLKIYFFALFVLKLKTGAKSEATRFNNCASTVKEWNNWGWNLRLCKENVEKCFNFPCVYLQQEHLQGQRCN